MTRRFTVGVVGARGYVGAELLPLVARHPALELAWVTSGAKVGARVAESVPALAGLVDDALAFRAPELELLDASPADVVVLALPNGEAPRWAARAGGALVVDLSADHRFDDAWVYAQPERARARIAGAKRLACPGCYATAAQLAVDPVRDAVRAAHAFGVSGVSGAGATPSPRNDPERLRDNVLPYAVVDHVHERELRRALGLDVFFTPHVAPFFRGLVVTASIELARPLGSGELAERIAARYAGERFVRVVDEPPSPRDAAGEHGVRVGGAAVSADGRRAVVVAALDNLLGGAASQALRATNLALGLDEAAGLDDAIAGGSR